LLSYVRCDHRAVLSFPTRRSSDLQQATEFYMECALAAGLGVVNCMPVFIASDPRWEARFRERRLPIIGDDIKAQVGATIVHRTLDRKSTRLNSSHVKISYAVFCLK